MKTPRPSPLLNWPEIEAAKEKVAELKIAHQNAFRRAIGAPDGKKRERQKALLEANIALLRAEIELDFLLKQ